MVDIGMFKIVETILKCSKDEHYLVDEFYFRYDSKKEAKDQKFWEVFNFLKLDLNSIIA